MIFFIGAKNSGKRNLAIEEIGEDSFVADGNSTNIEEIYNSNVFCSINDYIKKGDFKVDNIVYGVKENALDIYEFIDGILSENKDIVITCDEVGAGIVPIDRALRDYRDVVGKMCQYIALKSDKVYRVTAGIKQRIK